LLRRLDVDAEHPYRVRGDDLKHVVAYVEASPSSLSARMALVESHLSGKRKLVLTSPASALVERVKSMPHVSQVKLWQRPFEVLLWQAKLSEEEQRQFAREMFVFDVTPSLLRGRMAYLRGTYDGEQGAKRFLLSARPTKASIENFKLGPEMARQIKKESHSQVEAIYTLALQQSKQDASYWLGLVSFDEKDYPTAIEYFDRFTLADHPKGRWTSAARYNLGRVYEAQGQLDRAVVQFESDSQTPQWHGNQLRARWLKEKPAAAAKSAESAAR
jgi:tetratricopeptide (TPR) repeat protein